MFKRRRTKAKVVSLAICCLFLGYILVAAGHGMTYNRDEHNCRHMSRDLENMLEAWGFDVKVITGWLPGEKKNGHAWIAVNGLHIDSVNLLPRLDVHLGMPKYSEDIRVFESYQAYRDDYYARTGIMSD